MDTLRQWRPPRFTAKIRGFIADPPPYERWEALLRAERSAIHQLVLLLARSRLLRRVLKLPAHLAAPPGLSVEEREQRVSAVSRTSLARIARRLAGSIRERPRAEPPMPPAHPGTRPYPGPLVHREIDAELAFLRNMPFDELQRHGSQLHPNHFEWPLNIVDFLRENPQTWFRQKVPEEVDWGLEGQEALIQQIRPYFEELGDVPSRPSDAPGQFVWEGGPFSGFDAYAYYGLVRQLRPRHVLEVGIGWSTLILRRALDANGEPAEVTLIDPYPNRELIGDLDPGWRIIEGVLQLTDLTEFDQLGAGDILFYDGSHCAHAGSDVNWMLFEVMPRLAEGVWVHFHDIFWPGDYPAPWLLDEGLTWNEQYMLQAFLMHNDVWKVRLAVSLLWTVRKDVAADLMDRRWPYIGASVWLEKVRS